MKEAILYLGSRFCLVSGFSSDAICAGAVSRRGRETPDESSSRREAKEVDFTASESRRGERAVSNRETGTRKRRRYGGVARGTPGEAVGWACLAFPRLALAKQTCSTRAAYVFIRGQITLDRYGSIFFGRITCLIFTPSLSLLERHTPDHHCITSYSRVLLPHLLNASRATLDSAASCETHLQIHQQSTSVPSPFFFKRTSPRHA